MMDNKDLLAQTPEDQSLDLLQDVAPEHLYPKIEDPGAVKSILIGLGSGLTHAGRGVLGLMPGVDRAALIEKTRSEDKILDDSLGKLRPATLGISRFAGENLPFLLPGTNIARAGELGASMVSKFAPQAISKVANIAGRVVGNAAAGAGYGAAMSTQEDPTASAVVGGALNSILPPLLRGTGILAQAFTKRGGQQAAVKGIEPFLPEIQKTQNAIKAITPEGEALPQLSLGQQANSPRLLALEGKLQVSNTTGREAEQIDFRNTQWFRHRIKDLTDSLKFTTTDGTEMAPEAVNKYVKELYTDAFSTKISPAFEKQIYNNPYVKEALEYAKKDLHLPNDIPLNSYTALDAIKKSLYSLKVQNEGTAKGAALASLGSQFTKEIIAANPTYGRALAESQRQILNTHIATNYQKLTDRLGTGEINPLEFFTKILKQGKSKEQFKDVFRFIPDAQDKINILSSLIPKLNKSPFLKIAQKQQDTSLRQATGISEALMNSSKEILYSQRAEGWFELISNPKITPKDLQNLARNPLPQTITKLNNLLSAATTVAGVKSTNKVQDYRNKK